ncbi:hypothetical protein [Hyalangium versicolor]|uniref:hypothetical protein n=1 Tax=Hyalangium versicolor TaxID=2861190 RepID=UPI001CCE8CE9|nr:hypothetical protein [Hyalangium versicolor]
MSKQGTRKSFIQYELPTKTLEQVQGGKGLTTLALGEEGGGLTTLVVGEECGDWPPRITTLALGEEGCGRF